MHVLGNTEAVGILRQDFVFDADAIVACYRSGNKLTIHVRNVYEPHVLDFEQEKTAIVFFGLIRERMAARSK